MPGIKNNNTPLPPKTFTSDQDTNKPAKPRAGSLFQSRAVTPQPPARNLPSSINQKFKTALSKFKISTLKTGVNFPKKIPMSGIINFFKGHNNNYVDTIGTEDINSVKKRANNLRKLCNKPGDAVLLTFGGGRHSAMLVYDKERNKPVYLSFYGDIAFEDHSNWGLSTEILHFKDMLYEDNIIKLEGMDNDAMLSKWRTSLVNEKYYLLTKNCSAITKKLLLAGSQPVVGDIHSPHDRIWQMPSNTKELAKDLRVKLQQKDSGE